MIEQVLKIFTLYKGDITNNYNCIMNDIGFI